MSFSISEENKFITLVYDLAKTSATNIFAFQHNQISKLTAFQMLFIKYIRIKCVQVPGKQLSQNSKAKDYFPNKSNQNYILYNML